MSAQIIELAAYRACRMDNGSNGNGNASAGCQVVGETPETAPRFLFWTGASGKRYVHTVYSLIDCPEVPAGNVVFVRRDENGGRAVLAIGRTAHDAPSLNLAEIRHRGATLGANEIHVHLLAETAKQAQLIEFDLKTAQFAKAFGIPHSAQSISFH